jgi:hypothetical protein
MKANYHALPNNKHDSHTKDPLFESRIYCLRANWTSHNWLQPLILISYIKGQISKVYRSFRQSLQKKLGQYKVGHGLFPPKIQESLSGKRVSGPRPEPGNFEIRPARNVRWRFKMMSRRGDKVTINLMMMTSYLHGTHGNSVVLFYKYNLYLYSYIGDKLAFFSGWLRDRWMVINRIRQVKCSLRRFNRTEWQITLMSSEPRGVGNCGVI